MPTAGSYSGLNAKIKAMRGRLLKQEDYEQLALVSTVGAFGDKLREHDAYDRVLAGLADDAMHRGDIEQRVVWSMADDFTRIYSFIGDHDLRAYLEAYDLRDEIETIKFLLCAIYDERQNTYTASSFVGSFARHLKIDVTTLAASKTVDAFIENLRGTVFYNVLARRFQEETPSLFDLEMELDLYYYMHLWAFRKKRLDSANRKAIALINGTEIDLQNISWAYRLKTYYRVEDTTVYTYLIPYRYKLSQTGLARIVEAQSAEELNAAILATPYARYFAEEMSVDVMKRKAMDGVFRAARRLYPHTLAATLSYLYEKETEIRRIVSLLESVRYGIARVH